MKSSDKDGINLKVYSNVIGEKITELMDECGKEPGDSSIVLAYVEVKCRRDGEYYIFVRNVEHRDI